MEFRILRAQKQALLSMRTGQRTKLALQMDGVGLLGSLQETR